MPADIAVFARGLAIGVAVAAPVGPMSILCMRRTLTRGMRYGLGTGAGIAAGDGLYALVAALGLAGVMHFMIAHERPLHFAAGAFLMYLGWRSFFSPSTRVEAVPEPGSVVRSFGSALLLTLTNPPTILSFVAILTAFVPAGFDALAARTVAAGVFTGSLLWWLGLTSAVATARRALGPRARRRMDRLSGIVLVTLGAVEVRRAA